MNGITYNNVNFSAWSWNTGENRAVPGQPDNSGDRRVAFAYGDFDVLIDVSDNAAHEVTFYILDWYNYNIRQRIDLLDPTTNAVLATSDTQSNFSNGRYVRFRFQGDVRVRFTSLGGWSAILNGIFFDGNTNTIHPTLPLTYTWQAAGQAPVTRVVNNHNPDSVAWTWNRWGRQPVTLTVSNLAGSTTTYHAIDILTPPAAPRSAGLGPG